MSEGWRETSLSYQRLEVPLTCCSLLNKGVSRAPNSRKDKINIIFQSYQAWLYPQPENWSACQSIAVNLRADNRYTQVSKHKPISHPSNVNSSGMFWWRKKMAFVTECVFNDRDCNCNDLAGWYKNWTDLFSFNFTLYLQISSIVLTLCMCRVEPKRSLGQFVWTFLKYDWTFRPEKFKFSTGNLLLLSISPNVH